MRTTTIVVVSKHTSLDDKTQGLIDRGIVGCYMCGDFKILKFKTMVDRNNEAILFNTTHITYMASLILNIENKKILKNRFGSSELSMLLGSLPSMLYGIFAPVVELLCGNIIIEDLKMKYSINNLLHALYLTNNYVNFKETFDIIHYHLIRFSYGKQVPLDLVTLGVDKYPELLI